MVRPWQQNVDQFYLRKYDLQSNQREYECKLL